MCTHSAIATRITALGALCIAALLTACGEAPAPAAGPVSRPVKLFTVDSAMSDAIRRFPATIEASTQAELAFRVPGRLQELPIREGDIVEDGELVARLDPTDYEIALEDRQASFDNASRNFRRAQELVGDGNISRLDFDRMEAEFRSARAALAQAKTNLGYTELRAPFTGRIARREVENFEEVLAKQTIAHLQDTDELDVIIALPESVVRSVSSAAPEEISTTSATQSSAAEVRALVSFEDHADIRYALDLKEIATRADKDTQTFRVTFSMPQPEEFTVLPGMTAEVELDFTGMLNETASTWVPARAVQADAELGPRVWVLDPDSMTVSSRPVEAGRLAGDMIEILTGLAGGEEIVAAGAAYLSERMAVTRMANGEQAVSRDSEGGFAQ
jgi:RND family efflux transporter MFP subunit